MPTLTPTADAIQLHSFSFAALGTQCALHIYHPEFAGAESVARSAIAEVQRIESRWSRYRPDSVLAAINRVAAVGGAVTVDEETAALLDYAFASYEKSGGLFDITSGVLRKAWDFNSSQLPQQQHLDELLPRVGLDKVLWSPPCLTFSMPGMELDFGGLGKEYAADRVADLCLTAGVAHGTVDLGGDFRVIGSFPSSEPWQIGIRHPRRPDTLTATAEIARGGLATSGDYERRIAAGGKYYSHILNPRTGWPVEGLCSVSVLADECLLAGTVCTMAMLQGRGGIAWLDGLGLPHLWIDEAGCQGGCWPSAGPTFRAVTS